MKSNCHLLGKRRDVTATAARVAMMKQEKWLDLSHLYTSTRMSESFTISNSDRHNVSLSSNKNLFIVESIGMTFGKVFSFSSVRCCGCV